MLQYLAGEHHPHEALPARSMWLATCDESPVGYVAGHLTRRFSCDGELQWIYVVSDHRRAGVGSRLLCLMSTWFLDRQARRVCVDVGNDEARPFYRDHGAKELNRHWMVWDDIGCVLDMISGERRHA